MYIYKITNLINNKIYIGKTSAKNPNRRWNEHKSIAKNQIKPSQPITRAIKKYGVNNFKYEIILTCSNHTELSQRERDLIYKFNSFAPKGYNITEFQPYKPMCLRHRVRLSKSKQGSINPSHKNKFTGAYESCGRFYCEIQKGNERYKKSFNNKIKSAIAYDKMALYLYGKNARINFELKRGKYLNSNLDKFFKSFNTLKYSSIYNGVYFNNSRKRWIAVGYESSDSLIRKTKWLKTEIEAAKMYDMMCIYFNTNINKVNFKSNITYYKSLDLKNILNFK